MQRPRGIYSHFSFISSIRQPLPLHRFIARAVSGEGGERRQHVSSDVALEMERRKNARLEARMKDLMKALTGVDNGGASKN